VAPAAVVLGLFSIFPVCYAFYVSLHRWGLKKQAFVGFGNYARALSDPEFGRAMLVTIYYVLGTVPVGIALGLLVANLLAERIRGRGVYRTIYFLPYVTSVVAAAAVWVWILYPAPAEWGLANAAMRFLGLPEQAWVEESRGVFLLLAESFGLTVPKWAAGPSLALVCVMAFSVWHALGFEVVVLLAALSNVPREIYEAAALDGATGWQRLRRITIPMISPTLFFLLIISTIRAFRVFSHIYVLASKDTERTAHNVTMFIFRTFYEMGETGYGSAVALILFVIILLVTLVQMRVLGARVHY
jgi:multiple sugar transport system permease protein